MVVVANLGAEEDFDAPTLHGRTVPRAAQGLVHAWQEWLRSTCSPVAVHAFGTAQPLLVPWLMTPAVERDAHARGRALWGAGSDVVRRLHDKAFAIDAAARLGVVDEDLARACTAFAGHDCARDASGAAPIVDAIHAVVARWPARWQRDFTCKPRLGTSGRGRVRGGSVALDVDALVRCAARGGIVVEPWLARTVDVSTQFLVHDDGRVECWGTTQQLTNAAGRWHGARFVLGDDGLARAGTRFDDEIAARATIVVREMARCGHRGVCGVDAFAFVDEDGSHRLRAVVECNARFTGGAVAIGLARARSMRGDVVFRVLPDGSCAIDTV